MFIGKYIITHCAQAALPHILSVTADSASEEAIDVTVIMIVETTVTRRTVQVIHLYQSSLQFLFTALHIGLDRPRFLGILAVYGLFRPYPYCQQRRYQYI